MHDRKQSYFSFKFFNEGSFVLKKILFTAVLFSSLNAFAVDGTSESKQSTLLDDLYFGVTSIWHGPGVTKVDQPFTPNANGNTVAKPTSAMNFDSELTAAYMFDKNTGVGPVVPFFAYPVLGKGFSIGDVGIKAFNRKFLRRPRYGDLREYHFPTSHQ